MTHRQRKAARVVAEIAIIVLIVAGIRAWQHAGIANGAAPDLRGTTLGGIDYVLAHDTRRPLLVHFWATWCSICALEQGTIDALAREYNVVTVAMQSGSAGDVGAHLRANDLAFAVVNDPDGRLAAQWGVRAVPASFVVDAAGQIRFKEVGYTTGAGLSTRLWWAGF